MYLKAINTAFYYKSNLERKSKNSVSSLRKARKICLNWSSSPKTICNELLPQPVLKVFLNRARLNEKIQELQSNTAKNDEVLQKKQTQIDNLEKKVDELKQAMEQVPNLIKELEDAQHAAAMYSEEMDHLRHDNAEKQSLLFQKL